MKDSELIAQLLANPDALLQKKPFYREISTTGTRTPTTSKVYQTETVRAQLPKIKRQIVTQEQFAKELDVYSHDVLFDENIPSITVKSKVGDGFLEIKQHRMAVPFQRLILNKQVRHLCVNRMNHTLLNTEPTERQQQLFIRIKQAWAEKNMEGAKTQFVQDQKSYGDAGLLFMIENGHLITKNISYDDGYVIITHKNNAGRHILECLYYMVDDVAYIDCYDNTYITRFTNEGVVDVRTGSIMYGGWILKESVRHGFNEIPLITKRGEVAWNGGQRTIESYEALYNTFIVIQKKYGWGALYVKGKFSNNGKKIANAIVLNDTSMDANADAKFLEPPTPQNMIETLDLMEQTIQKSCGTTFILPKDIRIAGDTSGLAVELTQELDMATAQDGVIEWQNVANKMMRLFKWGLAIELNTKKEKGFETAITEFEELRIYSEFMVWKPKSETMHNQMLVTLHGAGGISTQTFVEKNTVSTPDEISRIKKENQEAALNAIGLTHEASEESQNEETIVTENV